MKSRLYKRVIDIFPEGYTSSTQVSRYSMSLSDSRRKGFSKRADSVSRLVHEKEQQEAAARVKLMSRTRAMHDHVCKVACERLRHLEVP